jgi:hypothetical protein
MAVTYKPNRKGLQDVLRSTGVQMHVQAAAQSIANRAGASAGDPGGYTVSTRQGRSRFRAIVYADTIKAKRREASGNHLARALG